MPSLFSARLLRDLGITRVARVTGLDRAGVEVACAVRPLGHVLQVCNGKGASWEQAARSAVSEAAELWASERVDPTRLLLAAPSEMTARFGRERVWGPSRFGVQDAGRLSWIELEQTVEGGGVWVPASLVHCPPRGAPLFGLPGLSWTSNGCAAHVSAERALRHALLEVIERDQLARALPQGWTRAQVRKRRLGGLPAPVRERVDALERQGFRCILIDATPDRSFGIPIAGALLLDEERGPVPLTAGYSAAATAEAALIGALEEAAQSRLTDIHGAREDVEPMPSHEVDEVASWLSHEEGSRRISEMPKVPAREASAPALARRLARRGVLCAHARWRTPDGSLEIVKVICPRLRRSELL